MNKLSPHERETTQPFRLEYVLERDGELLELLTAPGQALTRERLTEIEALTQTPLLDVIEEAKATGLNWPDEATDMDVVAGGHIERHLEDEQSDRTFLRAVMSDGGRVFNNFSALLHTLPLPIEPDEDSAALFRRHGSMKTVVYGTKPYLWRAHLIAKDFMEALQYDVAAAGDGGMAEWHERLIQGGLEPEVYPQDAALLTASRMAYVLLINLMRADDLKLQYEWLGMGEAPEITDPERELWT